MSKPTTKKYFKYRSLSSKTDRKYACDILINNQLYFASGDSFNDPFEFHSIIDFKGSKNQILDYFEKTGLENDFFEIFHQMKKMSTKDFDKQVRPILESVSYNKIQGLVKKRLNSLGVLCLSSEEKNINLWSNYANSHKGICFQFESVEGNDYFSQATLVEYTPKINTLSIAEDYSDKTLMDFLKKISRTKYEAYWTHEKEYRIIKDKPAAYKFNPLSLKAIYLGCRFDPKDDFLNVVKKYKPDCEVVYLQPAKDSYSLVVKFRKNAEDINSEHFS